MTTISDIADEAGVSTATVSRVLNNSNKVSSETRLKVKKSIKKLGYNVKKNGSNTNSEVTVKEIALEAKVSAATVSRVINNSARVTITTRKKVRKAMKKLNYSSQANYYQQNKSIALVIPDIWNPFFGGIIKGVENLADKHDYKIKLFNTSGDLRREKNCIQSLESKNIAGLIFMGKSFIQQQFDLLSACDFPVVIISREEEGINFPTVNIDNYQAAYDMTDYLATIGYQKIAFVSGPIKDKTAGLRRKQGYSQAMSDNNLKINPDFLATGNFSFKSGYLAAEEILNNDLPDAVFAANDEMAVGVIRKIKEQGLKVPGDIAVAGFDGISSFEYINPNLTTVKQPIYNLGKLAMEIILQLSKGKRLKKTDLVLDYELLIKEST